MQRNIDASEHWSRSKRHRTDVLQEASAFISSNELRDSLDELRIRTITDWQAGHAGVRTGPYVSKCGHACASVMYSWKGVEAALYRLHHTWADESECRDVEKAFSGLCNLVRRGI